MPSLSATAAALPGHRHDCLAWRCCCAEQGPWRACFRVSRGQILRPSVIVKVSYFTINQMTLVGTSFEWERDAAKLGVNPGQMDTTALGEPLGAQAFAGRACSGRQCRV